MKITRLPWKTMTFDVGDDFLVDLVESEDEDGNEKLDLWFYYKGYGLKQHVNGVVKKIYEEFVGKPAAEKMLKGFAKELPERKREYFKDMAGEEIG